jgi:hypothetical protein
MTKNRINIQTISTKRRGFQTHRILQLEQVIEKKEKANPLHFLKFPLISAQSTHMVLSKIQAGSPQNPKTTIFDNPFSTKIL